MKTCIVALVALCCWLAVETTASACSCLPTDVVQSYPSADHVVHVRVERAIQHSSKIRRYLAVLVDPDFKGCLAAGERVVIETAGSSAACGMSLGRTEYLLYGARVRDFVGLPALRIGACEANRPWPELTGDEVAFLVTREPCCGESCD